MSSEIVSRMQFVERLLSCRVPNVDLILLATNLMLIPVHGKSMRRRSSLFILIHEEAFHKPNRKNKIRSCQSLGMNSRPDRLPNVKLTLIFRQLSLQGGWAWDRTSIVSWLLQLSSRKSPRNRDHLMLSFSLSGLSDKYGSCNIFSLIINQGFCI